MDLFSKPPFWNDVDDGEDEGNRPGSNRTIGSTPEPQVQFLKPGLSGVLVS